MNHRITFPRLTAGSPPITADVSAPSHDLAVRSLLEHLASEGHVLDYVDLSDIQNLDGACLDGLKLSHCRLSRVQLNGASLKRCVIERTTFDKVFADKSTCMDDGIFEHVRFVDSTLNGMSARRAYFSAIRFEHTSAVGLNVEDASFSGVRTVMSNLTGWHAHMAHLSMFEDAPGVIDSAALGENGKAALRALIHSGGDRAGTLKYLARIESSNA